jgi:glycosyltransferase involved in cell wall biosynthesis
MPELPLVTVIAMCFNHERFVLECLESVRAQTYPNVQLVIADDCSTDRSVELIRSWLSETGTEAELLLHRENQGLCRTKNETLALARGAYVAALSTDDIWFPDKLAAQVELMEQLPSSVGVLYGDAFRMDEQGQPLPRMAVETFRDLETMPEGDIYAELLEGSNFILGMTTLIRRECFEAVGPYDESLPYEDWDMFLRIASRYEFAFSPRVSGRYRVHRSSLSQTLGDRYWDADLQIQLKHVGARPELDGLLWKRIAYLAYRTGHPEARTYARNALKTGGWRHALALNALHTARVPYRRVAPITRLLRRLGVPRTAPSPH